MRARRHTAAAPILLLLAVAASRPVRAAGSSLWSAGLTTLRSSADGYTVATTRGERPLALPAGSRSMSSSPCARVPSSAPVRRSRRRAIGAAICTLGWSTTGWHALPSPEMDDEAAKVRARTPCRWPRPRATSRP